MNEAMTHEEKLAPMHEHLAELRKRVLFSFAFLLLSFAVSYYFAEEIYRFLVAPLSDILEGQDRRLIYTGLAEAFFTYMKVAFYAGLFISFPVFTWQFYRFLAPGLYKKEKYIALPFLLAAPVLFIAGGALVYYQIFPLAWTFFLSFESMGTNNSGLAIQLEARISEYLDLVIQLIFAFGLAFQLPILLLLLVKAGVITSQWLSAKRRYAIVAIFIFAAAFTPPDIISQIGLALPMLLLYECSVFFAKILEKKNIENEKKEETDHA